MQTPFLHNVKWKVSLSNGETLHEEKGEYISVKGELSPWQKLLAHLEETNARVTSLSLYTDDGQTFNLPSAGKNPQFKMFNTAPIPKAYKMFRQFGQDYDGKHKLHFTVAEAMYELANNTGAVVARLILQIWVDENNTRNTWSLVNIE